MFTQPKYIASILGNIAKSNAPVLDALSCKLEHQLAIPIQSNISLLRLCEMGAQDSNNAWPIYQALWRELMVPGRPPVLFSLDGFNHIMQNSEYRSPTNEPVHAHDLAIVKQFLDFLTGQVELPNGGAILAATSRSHAKKPISMELYLRQQIQRQEGHEEEPRDPWCRDYDKRVDELLNRGVEVFKLEGLTRKETRGYLEYWARSGLLTRRINEAYVGEVWALSGHGLIGQMERAGLQMAGWRYPVAHSQWEYQAWHKKHIASEVPADTAESSLASTI